MFSFLVLSNSYFAFDAAGAVQQDGRILRNTYNILRQFNPRLRIDSKLEKLAQHYRCVKRHSDHKSTDHAALRLHGNWGANIAMHSHSRYNLAKRWKNSPGHYANIMRTNRMGCSVPKYGCQYIFCYHAEEN